MENKKILIRQICCILAMLALFMQKSQGQDTSQKKYNYPYYEEIDSVLLMNKAKLLCIPKSGIDDIDTIYREVMLQKCQLYHTTNKFYDVITVKSNQFLATQVRSKKTRGTLYCGSSFEGNLNCFYTLVFSYHTFRFYFITGFASSDIKELDKEMDQHGALIYDVFSEELVKKLSIDFDCLAAKYLYEEDKYKGKRCDRECGRCMEMAEIH